MYSIVRVNHDDRDFRGLVNLLDAELAIRDGEDHEFYDQYNKVSDHYFPIVAYANKEPVACGAFKLYDPDTAEIKRMYSLKSYRGRGLATAILKELEKWAAEKNIKKCILETGINQPEAIALYHKNNYRRIPNFSPYENVETSYCFEKSLN